MPTKEEYDSPIPVPAKRDKLHQMKLRDDGIYECTRCGFEAADRTYFDAINGQPCL